MSDMTIHNSEPTLIEDLKKNADEKGISIEDEIKQIILLAVTRKKKMKEFIKLTDTI